MDLKPYMDATAFAELLGRDPRTIIKWCSLGYIPYYKEGRAYQVQTYPALEVLNNLSERGADIKDALSVKRVDISPGSQKAKDLLATLFRV